MATSDEYFTIAQDTCILHSVQRESWTRSYATVDKGEPRLRRYGLRRSNGFPYYLGLPKDHRLRLGVDMGAEWDSHIPAPSGCGDHSEAERTPCCLRSKPHALAKNTLPAFRFEPV